MTDYQLWPGDWNRIICGEAAETMAQLPNGCIDLTVTSPPYGNLRRYNGYTFDFEPIAQQLYRVTKPGGVVVWVVADETKNGSESGTSFKQALGFMAIGFNLHDTMIYERYGPPSVDIMHRRYYQNFEFMFIFSKGTPNTCNHLREPKKHIDSRKRQQLGQRLSDGTFTTRPLNYLDDKIKGNIWRYNVGGGHTSVDNAATNHPAAFPEALAHDHVISWSNPGDLVLDPMMGSGTTCKMAMITGRHYLGIDISAEYCELASQRLERVAADLRGELNHLPMFAGGVVDLS